MFIKPIESISSYFFVSCLFRQDIIHVVMIYQWMINHSIVKQFSDQFATFYNKSACIIGNLQNWFLNNDEKKMLMLENLHMSMLIHNVKLFK